MRQCQTRYNTPPYDPVQCKSTNTATKSLIHATITNINMACGMYRRIYNIVYVITVEVGQYRFFQYRYYIDICDQNYRRHRYRFQSYHSSAISNDENGCRHMFLFIHIFINNFLPKATSTDALMA